LGGSVILRKAAEPAKAINYCRLASEADPSNPNHAINFAGALIYAKQYASAEVVLRKILQLLPDNYTAHANLATALFQMKRFEEAKKEYQWLSAIKPNIPITYFFLAICHDNLQEYLDSMANYQSFLKLADAKANSLEIDKVNLRLPILQRQIKNGDGKKKK
jgi:tetratricopeptide (TPR) repeat protein